jgi:hypothetical protein
MGNWITGMRVWKWLEKGGSEEEGLRMGEMEGVGDGRRVRKDRWRETWGRFVRKKEGRVCEESIGCEK